MEELCASWLNAPQLNITQHIRVSTELNSHTCEFSFLSLDSFLSFFPSLARTYMVSHPEPLAMLGYHCKTGQ